MYKENFAARIAFICRGCPGLGRVSPSVALWQTLQGLGYKKFRFCTYLTGAQYCASLGLPYDDIGAPVGHFLEPISDPTENCVKILQDFKPDLVVVDGEPYLIPIFRKLGYMVLNLVNPHDLAIPQGHYQKMYTFLSEGADCTIASGVNSQSDTRYSLPPWVTSLPHLIKEANHNGVLGLKAAERPHVILTLGGGVSQAGKAFRESSRQALNICLEAFVTMLRDGQIKQATVLPNGISDIDPRFSSFFGINFFTKHCDLVDLLPEADVIITRAGRNTISELLYYQKAGVIIPISIDPLRGREQASNAELLKQYAGIKVINGAGITVDRVQDAVNTLLSQLNPFPCSVERGNAQAAQIVLELLSSKEKRFG